MRWLLLLIIRERRNSYSQGMREVVVIDASSYSGHSIESLSLLNPSDETNSSNAISSNI